ncbi:MAG: HD-GYP domain-containing protein [Nitrospira sp.]|nr:MAG: HD-GYP domain-containing protein [Nitrospira sp.]
MTIETDAPVTAVLPRVIAMLSKIDGLRLPPSSRRDVEAILVRQVTKELDHALPWHAGHGRNTANLAGIIGRALALDAEALHQLKLAAFLHDIGLLMLSPHLTENKAPLEPESYLALQHHARLGANLLEPFRFMREASVLIAHHHERWDGSGYPYGIRGAYIPLGARILAIADAFDAIQVPDSSDQDTRNRVALRILRVAAGTQFDPELVDLLCRIVRSAVPSKHDESFAYFHGSTLP